jgi:vacuolar-type H+-ATPase subunit H
MTLESRMQALLDLVEADRKRRCDTIIGDARARAAETIAAAHAEARGRMREAFAEERTRFETRVAAAQARLATHRRLHEQRRAGDLLAAGWRKLPAALCDRWREPETRRSWVASVIAEAHKLLPRGTWRIAYASEWPDDERRALAATLTTSLGKPPEFVVDDTARAGLKVSAAGNVIDGTLGGLTADRAEIGGRLLRALEGYA